ncbi:MAG: hypothetical protein Q4E05_09820 [Pseudoclavibacter sp.]|nr:hypothetical protein [Pseudoclavibacter sp.]
MNGTVIGALIGGVLMLTWIVLGFWQFVLVGLAMLIGAGIARIVEGRLDVRALAEVFRGRNSSS